MSVVDTSKSPLEMSDDELLDMPLDDVEMVDDSQDATTQVTDEDSTNSDAEDNADSEDAESEDTETKEDPVDATEDDETTTKVEDPAEATQAEEIDYKQVYEKLTAPFRANNVDVKVNNIDEALTLMQMGANYHKKMAGLKPHRQLIKMLDKNGLLDEAKLNYLIDLDKKNPEAITKLLKDSGIDPLNVDVDEESKYTPNSYKVDDREVALDTVLEDIQDSPHYSETLNIVGKKWDETSRKVILNEPEIIRVINSHVANGIYGKITEMVDHERMLGRLRDVSDLEAYKKVGDIIHSQGGFNSLIGTTQSNSNDTNNNKQKQNAELINRKKAASSPKAVTAIKTLDNFNPLALSDEEFEKTISQLNI